METPDFDYIQFVRDSLPFHLRTSLSFGEDAIEHVAHCLKELHGRINGTQQHESGSFVEALVKRDFYSALRRTDAVNTAAIAVYAAFIYNYAPANF